MIRVFIGYDRREAIGFHALSHSILARATAPVALDHVAEDFKRPLESLQSSILESQKNEKLLESDDLERLIKQLRT